MGVGNSNRTIGKHVLLNRLLGREVGIYSSKGGKPGFLPSRHYIADLCAGHGIPTDGSCMSSPQVIAKHAKFLKEKGHHVKCVMVEKDSYTYAELVKHGLESDIHNKNAREFKSPEELFGVKGFTNGFGTCFIHADPNHVHDWPISNELIASLPQYTTMLITMGCNVGGLKMLPREKRKLWFDRMDNLLMSRPKWHNVIMIVLNGDDAQWAYLIVGPDKWADVYIADAKKAFSYWPNGISYIDYKRQPDAFFQERDRLFLTKKELEAANAD